MIDYYTGTPIQEGMPKYYEAPNLAPMQLNTLTLERNSVLVVRVSKESGYDIGEMQALKKHLQDIFPHHSVFLWWDDIEFMAIKDGAYTPERMSLVNETQNYY